MTEKFITPAALPTDREREILTILIEEAAEVQQRATKALRFGLAEIQPGQPYTNLERIEEELGDLVGVLDLACFEGLVSQPRIEGARTIKAAKLDRYMQTESKINRSTPEPWCIGCCGGGVGADPHGGDPDEPPAACPRCWSGREFLL